MVVVVSGGVPHINCHALMLRTELLQKFLDIGEKHLEALNAPQELLLKMENSARLSLICLQGAPNSNSSRHNDDIRTIILYVSYCFHYVLFPASVEIFLPISTAVWRSFFDILSRGNHWLLQVGVT